MTTAQVDTLERIRSIQEWEAKQLADFCAANPGTYPSPWVSVNKLTSVHHLRLATIKALVRNGFLEMRSTDGWGNEVKPVYTRPLSLGETMRAERLEKGGVA